MDPTRAAKTRNKSVVPVRRSWTPGLLLCFAPLILPSASLALLYRADAKLAKQLIGYTAFINGLTYVTYSEDKDAASTKTWRVSEATLHLLALLGGWPAALAAQRVLRHKTQKVWFQCVFWLTVTVHQVLWASVFVNVFEKI